MEPTRPIGKHRPTIARGAVLTLALLGTLCGVGCQSMSDIDRKIDAVVRERAARTNVGNPPPVRSAGLPEREPRQTDTDPSTINPDASQLSYEPGATDESDVLAQLSSYYKPPPPGATRLDLAGALRQAQLTSREYLRAEEDYLLAAIRLLIERHDWGPRFFDTLSSTIAASDRESYESALSVVNELRVAQRLPYGGEVEARLVTAAAYQLIGELSDPNGARYDADTSLEVAARVPLLRDAGLIAREDLIQAERDLVYAARDFERFRRELAFSIAADYFRLINQLQGVANQRQQLRGIQRLYLQRDALVQAGRARGFELKNVEQRLLSARVALLNAQDSYKLALDRFKIRLGLDVTDDIVLDPVRLSLADPDASLEAATLAALTYRLDYQTEVDQIADAQRAVRNARNQLLPDLELTGSIARSNDADATTDSVSFDFEDTDYEAGITFGLPLDREQERLRLRQATIALERTQRDLAQFRDNLVLDARRALRDIKQARYSLDLQDRAVEINELRIEELFLRKDEVDAQAELDAQDDLLRSLNDRSQAESDLQIAILDYLLTSGQLRVDGVGLIEPLPGMQVRIDPLTIEGQGDLSEAPYSVSEDFLEGYDPDPTVNPDPVDGE